MDIGFIGLGNMGQPMARRLIAAGHKLVVYRHAQRCRCTVGRAGGASLRRRRPTLPIGSKPSWQVCRRCKSRRKLRSARAVSSRASASSALSIFPPRAATVAAKIAAGLAKKNIVQIDCPVSGGVGGATKGTLAVMVSGPKAEIDLVKDVLAVFGKVFVIGEKPGMAQTMKLANNFLSATAMAATSEAVAMGVKAGLDPAVMIDVINAGSGRTTASDGKFPQAILPRTFNYGFATALMLKDVRLCVEQAKSLDVPNSVMSAVLDQWETTNKEFGGDSDFTAIVKMVEQRAGVIVGKKT